MVCCNGSASAKVREDLNTAVQAGGYGGVAVKGVVCVEREQALGVIASPGGQPAIGELHRLDIGHSRKGWRE